MFLSRKELSQLIKLLTQADTRKPCVETEKSMSTQDILASQEKVAVNGTHSVDTEKSLCTQGNWCVKTTLIDWYTHRFLCVDAGFSCVRLCQELFFR